MELICIALKLTFCKSFSRTEKSDVTSRSSDWYSKIVFVSLNHILYLRTTVTDKASPNFRSWVNPTV